MQNIQNFEKWNDEMSRKYNIDTYRERSNWFIRWVENLRQKYIVKYLGVRPEDDVIDLGCGAGHLLEALPTAANLTGIDFSDFSLELARKRLGNKAQLVKGDVTALPEYLSERKFDKIACSEVIEHVVEPKRVIEEIFKIAANDSIIVISIPNEQIIDFIKWFFIKLGIFKLLFPNIPIKNVDEWHLTNFDKKLFERIVDKKLSIKKVKRIPFSFLPIRYIFVCKKIT
ncbi:MAG: hypothetical protein A2826_02740 [Candidatus Doudnabacteria bacterium RIFCSPHIGHO2_01_FULL_43_23]|uniref:Methyltransferase domain-containing protein n=1 Tax=Candidatus Doudnabacteria bacterium RIFCSPHIGHO2_01_FULL_43_23 TaxID=1817822 RepID=A0A1F5NRT7_9BACT|nr:MAG: hypothetical protein A2826_02740 [Candidatus Doudnabacteria bacterium RIFCSPHIGHO2_01_FULL_43_23]